MKIQILFKKKGCKLQARTSKTQLLVMHGNHFNDLPFSSLTLFGLQEVLIKVIKKKRLKKNNFLMFDFL